MSLLLVEAMGKYLAAVEREKQLKRLHADRLFLSSIRPTFTLEQLTAYRDRIDGIERRFGIWQCAR